MVHRSWTSRIDAAFLRFVARDVAGLPAAAEALPAGSRRERAWVIVLGNYSVHRATVVQVALPALATAGVLLFFLPPHSPELNAIEPL